MIVVAIVALIVVFLAGIYPAHLEHVERENLKSQIDSSIWEADSLIGMGSFEGAIDEYEGISEVVSPKKFPDKYATTQNNLGFTYVNLARVRDKETNLEKAIHAFQEASNILTVERYPINYATTQNNIGGAYRGLAEVRDEEANLEKAINAFQKALIYAVENHPIHHAHIQSHLRKIS